MRICQALGWYFPENLGGTENYVRSLAQGLAERGLAVSIVAPLAGIDHPREYDHDGIPVFRYPVPRNPTRDEAQGVVPARGSEHLRAWLERVRPDIFHVHSLVTGLGLHEMHAARALGARIVYTNHLPSTGFVCGRGTLMRWGSEACDGVRREVTCGACLLQQRGVPRRMAVAIAGLPSTVSSRLAHLPGPAGTALGIRNLVREAGVRQQALLDVCDCIVPINERSADIFRANGAPPQLLQVNPLGVRDQGLPRKPGPSQQPTRIPVRIGFIGRLHVVKGLHILTDAWRRLAKDLALELRIAGPIGDPDSLTIASELAKLAADDPRVTFLAGVPADRVGQALAEIDVLCCPSIWFENGPLVALESMAVGTPVIGTTIGAFAEFIHDDHNGRILPPNDAAALAEALQQIAEDPAIVDRWRRNLGHVRTMSEVVADYIAIYETIAAAPVAAHR